MRHPYDFNIISEHTVENQIVFKVLNKPHSQAKELLFGVSSIGTKHRRFTQVVKSIENRVVECESLNRTSPTYITTVHVKIPIRLSAGEITTTSFLALEFIELVNQSTAAFFDIFSRCFDPLAAFDAFQ